jgi:hypothetical protein
LIQETGVSDSIIAHFGRSTAHWPTFATQSLRLRTYGRDAANRRFGPGTDMALV